MKILAIGLVLAGLLAFSPATHAAGVCPPGFTYDQGICWEYISPPPPSSSFSCLKCKSRYHSHWHKIHGHWVWVK
jgi:hypothetical protein